MKSIPLTKGKKTLVDDEDFQELNQWSWHLTAQGYAARRKTISPKNHKIVLMHRELIKTPKGLHTDHANGDRLDNRKINLRVCTKSENSLAFQRRLGGSSRFRGVSWNIEKKKWEAYLGTNGKRIRGGYFKNEIQAAIARDRLAKAVNPRFLDLNYQIT